MQARISLMLFNKQTSETDYYEGKEMKTGIKQKINCTIYYTVSQFHILFQHCAVLKGSFAPHRFVIVGLPLV